MNELLRLIMRQEGFLTRTEAVEYIRETYVDSGRDIERTLYDLGFEDDFAFDLEVIIRGR